MRNPIYVIPKRLTVTTDLFGDGDPTGDYVIHHTVELDIACRWQRQGDRMALLDWDVHALHLDGTKLERQEDVPNDCPAHRIVNACFSRRMREALESEPPTMKESFDG